MPYIAIKSFPKDEETKKKVVDKINQVFLEVWGCQQEALTISLEEIVSDEWEKKVVEPEMEPKKDHMMIFNGKKKY